MSRHPLIHALLALTLCCGLSLSWALPSPKDIEAALNAGQTAQAESMLREVLKEKPQSAKAHYELGQVLAREGRYEQALSELRLAQSIDSSLKFAHSPEQFERIVSEVKALDAKRSLASPSPVASSTAAPAPAHAEPALQMSTVWWGIGLLFVVGGVFLMKRTRNPAPSTPYAPTPAPDAPRGFGANYTPAPPAGYPPAGYPPAAGGSGVAGAVVGGLAGVAAGYALAKAMEGSDHGGSSGVAQAGQAGGYVPFDNPAPTQLDAFDTGSGGDSWDNGGDSSSGDDTW